MSGFPGDQHQLYLYYGGKDGKVAPEPELTRLLGRAFPTCFQSGPSPKPGLSLVTEFSAFIKYSQLTLNICPFWWPLLCPHRKEESVEERTAERSAFSLVLPGNSWAYASTPGYQGKLPLGLLLPLLPSPSQSPPKLLGPPRGPGETGKPLEWLFIL